MGDVAPPRGSDHLDRRDLRLLVHAAFLRHDPRYDTEREPFMTRWKALRDRLGLLQDQGHPMRCFEQIALEAKWLLNYRCDWVRLRGRLDALERYRPSPWHRPARSGRAASPSRSA